MKNPVNYLVVIILLINQSVPAQAESDAIDSLMTYCADNGIFNGTILVSESGNIIYKEAFGLADFETGEKLEPDHSFYLASVSKQFTAMCIMMLKEKGDINYDDKLSDYFNDFPDYAESVTIRHLMTHTSGIPNYYRLIEPYPGLSNKDVYSLLVKVDTLDFYPGEKYRYSNGGYLLLALIIEKVSGMSLHDFMKDNIFIPLEMNNTVVYDSNYTIIKRAAGYDRFMRKDDYKFNTTGAGGIYSTVEDLHKWDQALYSNKLVSKETLQEAYSSFVLNDGSVTNYGFGWVIISEYGNIVSHGGSLNGFRTFIHRDLDEKKTFIYLSNNGDAIAFSGIIDALYKILTGDKYELPKIPVSQKMNEVLRESGIEKLVKTYYELKAKSNDRYDFSENQLNLLGYNLLNQENMIDEAIEIFKLNTAVYPEAYNTYDSLGEAYMQNRQYDQALKNYKISLELNPENKNAEQMIIKIKGLLN